jgi:tRNA 2-selenouridine synthase
LKGIQSKETIEDWLALAAQKNFTELARQLMQQHYDPLYVRSRKRREDQPETVLEMAGTSEEDFSAAAAQLLA